MSGRQPFELDELDHDTGFVDPHLPPPRPGLQRTREPPPRRLPNDPPPDPLVNWILAPTTYYLIATLTATAGLFAWFNPTFGLAMEAWPWEAIGFIGKADLPASSAVLLVGLFLASLGGLIGCCFGRRALRPGWMATAFLLPYLARPDASDLFLLPAAFTAGILMSGAPPRARRGHLFSSLVVLGGALFFPLPAAAGAPYASIATSAIETVRAFGDGSTSTLAATADLIPVVVALGILTLGGLAWMGLGGNYIRWSLGILLLVGYAIVAASGIDGGAPLATRAELSGWQAGLVGFAETFRGAGLALLLPLTAAVCEWQRRAAEAQ